MKKIIFTLLSLSILINTHSQEMKKNTEVFSPGMYVGANIGLNVFLAEGNKFYQAAPYALSFNGNTGFVERVEIGYDFTSFIGIRGFIGNSHHYWPDIRYKNTDGSNRIVSLGSESLTTDLMLNLSNGILGYNSHRFFNLSVFGGIGFEHRDKANFSSDLYTGVLRGGIQGDFRLLPRLDLNVIADGNLVGDNFNDYAGGNPFDIYAVLSVGVTYRLNDNSKKQNSTEINDTSDKLETKNQANPSDVTPLEVNPPEVTPPEVEPTTEQSPEASNDTSTETSVVTAPTVAPKHVVKQKPLLLSAKNPIFKPSDTTYKYINKKPIFAVNIFYPFNETGIDADKQKEAIAKIVDFLKQFPTARITVRGYADKGTGTHAFNHTISNNRAENVTDILIKTYNIFPKRIKTKAIGCSYQPFKQENMNRLVVVTSDTSL